MNSIASDGWSATLCRRECLPAVDRGAAGRVSISTSSIRSFYLDGPAGRLEAVLNESDGEAPLAALVCHPHPVFGGTLHNKVVYRTMKALHDEAWGVGLPVLRFNFRGTGLSEGEHDGATEVDDVLAAIAWLEREYQRPVLVAGFSFGAAMAIRACGLLADRSGDAERVAGLIALGLPTIPDYAADGFACVEQIRAPKLFLCGDQDRFSTRADLERIVDRAAEPKHLEIIAGADHFFTHQLDTMQRAIASWLKERLP